MQSKINLFNDKVVNTIIAEFMGYTFDPCDGDERDNFIKGCIYDDRDYDEDLCPTGGSIVINSQDLYTESLENIPEVLKKLNLIIEFDPNKKETIEKSFAYTIAEIILTSF